MNTCLNIESISWMKAQLGGPFADLIFADPPFNINWKYDIYIDKMPDDQFIDWNRRWITEAKRLLNPTGQIYICMYDEYVSEIDVMCRKELGLFKQNHLIWHFSFGQSGELHKRRRFTRSKMHILRFSKHPTDFTFNSEAIAVPSDRQLKYADKRADGRGKCPNDVLLYNRIAGTHADRVKGMSTQMPIEMVKMLIEAVTNPKDVVYDPFPGSGVSLRASMDLNRQFLGTELSPGYHARIIEILKLQPNALQSHNNNLSADPQQQ